MPNPSDHPALDAYNAKRASGWNLNVWDTVCLADAMKEEFKDRIKALEAEFAAERGKRCDWLSEDCTDAATYIPEIDAVRFSQGVRDDCSTVYIGRDEAAAILALLTAEQGATDE